jgi:hypothetical protein
MIVEAREARRALAIVTGRHGAGCGLRFGIQPELDRLSRIVISNPLSWTARKFASNMYPQLGLFSRVATVFPL